MSETKLVPRANIPADPFAKSEEKANSPSPATQRSSLLSLGGELFAQFFLSVNEQLESNAGAGLNDEQNAELATYLQTSNPGILAKRDRLGEFFARLDSEAEAIRNEEKRLAARRAGFEKIRSCMLWAIHSQMSDAGVKRVEGKLYTFALHKSPDSVEIENESLIPAEYISYSPQIDKRAIGDALHEGKKIPGAKLITSRTHLVIR